MSIPRPKNCGTGMAYIVEVHGIGPDLADTMKQMRAWLDHHRIDATAFEQSSVGPEVAVRLSFSIEAEALAFAQVFGVLQK
jgi:hypothetical protein